MKTKDMTEIACNKCGELLPATEFRLRKRISDRGYEYETREQPCRACRNRSQRKNTVYVRACAFCNTEIITTKPNKLYCCVECQKRAHYLRTYVRVPRQLKMPLRVFVCAKCGSTDGRYGNSSYCKECDKASVKEYREKRKEADPEWHAKERERLRVYSLDNPHVRTRREKRDGDTLRKKDWEAILDTWGYRCAYCDSEGDMQKDHIIPYSKGGVMSVENIIPACPSCNSAKSNIPLSKFVNPDRLIFIYHMVDDQLYNQHPW